MPLTTPKRFRKRRQLAPLLNASTLREFSGGWNVIDSELNLAPKFARVFTNVFRHPDGSVANRYGTKLFVDFAKLSAETGALGDNPLVTTSSSATVTVSHGSHDLVSGQKVTLAGCTTTNGIPDTELNAEHTITVVTSDSYTITVTTTATSSGAGGGTSVTYSHTNNILTGNIIEAVFYQSFFILFSDNGTIARVDPLGVAAPRVIWSDDIGNALSGAPGGWASTVQFVSTTVFSQNLLCANGIDKPLIIDLSAAVPVQYLVDAGTGSNTNTPIGRYIITVGEYVIISGDPTDVDAIYISNKGTAGTFPSDPAPNDALTIHVAKYISTSNSTIRGLSRFSGKLAVAFDSATVLVVLGIYNDSGDHIPDLSDTIENYGSIAHRSMIPLGNDLLMCDVSGVPSIRKAKFIDSEQPERASQLVDPAIQAMTTQLTIGAAEDNIFAVQNKDAGQYMLFVPNDSDNPTETVGFVLTRIQSLRVNAWAKFTGWNWACGVTTDQGRVFFAKGRKLFAYGSQNDEYWGDYINDQDISDPDNGVAVSGTWRLPWLDFKDRARLKTVRFMALDTQGDAEFTISTYIDEYPNAQLTQRFVAGDSGGYGVAGSQPYGGGRRTREPRLWVWPVSFKLARWEFTFSTTRKLRIAALTLLHHGGQRLA